MNEDQKPCVYDFIRKKWLILTPEEMVRQLWIKWLYTSLHWPILLFSIEKSIKINHLKKRIDLLFYKNGLPYILFEFKRWHEPINEQAAIQIAYYNFHIKAPYLILSNGIDHYLFEIQITQKKIIKIDHIIAFLQSV